MKRTFLLTIMCIMLCMDQITRAMDEAPKNHSIDTMDTIATTIITALDSEFYSDALLDFANSIGFMEEQTARAITQHVNDFYTKRYPSEKRTKEIFDTLCGQSNSFKAAISLLKIYARNNLLSLAGNTLATIEDPAADQPLTTLNSFPPAIKKYLMECALDDYQDTTKIALIGDDEWEPITAFDICAVTQQAATSYSNCSLCLWDLTRAKPITSQSAKHSVKQICFNNDGSLIATRSNKKVLIWQPTTARLTLCYALQLNQEKLPTYHLSYAQETSLNLLSIFHKNTKSEGASVWLTNHEENKSVCFQKNIAPVDAQPSRIKKGIYSADNPQYQVDQSILYVTKKNFHPLLLCKIAAEQTRKSTDVSPILVSQSYGQLTPHDCDVFYATLKQNPCFKNNTQPITSITNPTNT